MKIGGLQKISLIDYPGTPAAIIFTQGCNMVCPYCHNTQLVYPKLFEDVISEEEVLTFLKNRQGLLKGVVITGGEPTIQPDLDNFIKKIKSLNFLVKLDTNGTNPAILKNLIKNNLIDFIAMDIKAPFKKYDKFFGGEASLIEESVKIIKESNIAHLFRTTFDRDILNNEDITEIKQMAGSSEFILQQCNK